MTWSHKHHWENVSFESYWEYGHSRCSRAGSWQPMAVYQIESPGEQGLYCSYHGDDWHYRSPTPYTTITQKCDCGEYRNQTVEGIVKEDV